MPRPKRRSRHQIDWKTLEPCRLGEATRQRLLDAAGIDMIDEKHKKRGEQIIAEVEGLLGVYPGLRTRHDLGPRPSQFRIEVAALFKGAAQLLHRLDAISDEVRDDLIHDHECPEIDLSVVRAQLLRLQTMAQFLHSAYAKDNRGQPYQLAKRMLIFGLCRVFQRLHCQEEEAAEDAKKEFVRETLEVGRISCRSADLNRWLSKLPLDLANWPLDLEA